MATLVSCSRCGKTMEASSTSTCCPTCDVNETLQRVTTDVFRANAQSISRSRAATKLVQPPSTSLTSPLFLAAYLLAGMLAAGVVGYGLGHTDGFAAGAARVRAGH